MRSDVFPRDTCVVSTEQNGAISQMTPEQINYTFNCDFNQKRSIKIYEVFRSVLCHRFLAPRFGYLFRHFGGPFYPENGFSTCFETSDNLRSKNYRNSEEL